MSTLWVSQRIHNAPLQPTPFLGRQTETAEIAGRLADPRCRLITLVGLGGIGKTRLALQAANHASELFASGVWFVPLQSVSSSHFLATALADVLGIALTGVTDPKPQLLHYLRDRHLLLILDSFEHLFSTGGAEFVLDLLQSAPGLKLMVTSREALKLQEELLYAVDGMPVPPIRQAGDLEADDLESYAVIQLFVERATRVSKDFSFAAEKADVVRICRLVDGVPLAVELAASWTYLLRCHTIAAEIEHNLRFLQTELRDVPDWHRSMQAVFDNSWKLLAKGERTLFAQLSIFQGGFQREAAAAVTGATLPLLAGLVRKSLLTVGRDERYQMHGLLRQYASERLMQAAPGDAQTTHDRHAAYYLRFLAERNAAMNGGRQLQATSEIAAEIDNIRAAWHRAIEQGDLAAIVTAINPLYLFYQFRSRYREGIQMLEAAVQGLGDTRLAAHPGASLLFSDLGWLHVRLGRLDEAQVLFERSHRHVRRLGLPGVAAHTSDPRLGLGLLASLHGDYATAQLHLEQVYESSHENGHIGNRQTASYFLAGVHLAQGRYEEAQQYAHTAYAIAEQARNRWFMAYCLHEMGNAARTLGAYAEAKQHYQAGYALREEFADPEGMAVALNHLGAVAVAQREYAEAERLYQRSLAIYRKIDDPGGLVTALDGLARTYCASGQVQMAIHPLAHALRIATTAHFVALRLALFVTIGQLLLQIGRQEQALELLTFAQLHPSASHETGARARRLLDQSASPPLTRAALHDRLDDLDKITAKLQLELATLDPSYAPPASITPRARLLVEPLTARELELLQLLAGGLSYQEIAGRLIIAVGTVKSHAHHIYAKLGVRNRVQALSKAIELDLLSR